MWLKQIKSIPWGFILKICFAFGLIGFLVYRGDLDLKVLLETRHPGYVVIGAIVAFIGISVNNLRWTLLLNAQGFGVSFFETMKLSLMGLFFNFSLPSSVGGDVVKAYYLARDNEDKKVLAGISVLVDRIIGLWVMLGMAVITLLMNMDMVKSNPTLYSVFIPLLLLFVGMILFFIMTFSKSLHNWGQWQELLKLLPGFVEKVYKALNSFGKSSGALLWGGVLSVVSQMMAILFMIIFAQALAIEGIPLAAFFFAVPVGFIVMSLPLSPAGLGVGQVAFLTLFKMYTGEESQLGQLAITAYQLCLLGFGMIGAYYYMRRKGIEQPGKEASV